MDQSQSRNIVGSSAAGASATASSTLTPQVLRVLLSNLDRPHRLDIPEIRTLLLAHGRFPATAAPSAVGAAAASLIREKIAALRGPADATLARRMPHSVLECCFIRGQKNPQAAQELGVSERQLSRERTRALQLLAAELVPREVSVSPDPVPPTAEHLERDALVHAVAQVAARERLVAVVGRRGVGKTSAVAALAGLVRSDLVWWLRIRPGLNDCLESLLWELGRTLCAEDFPALRDYLLAAIPHPNLGTATRLALDGLARSPRLLVIDDFDRVRDPAPIEEFLWEGVERLGQLTIVTIGRPMSVGAVVEVPSLSIDETVQLVEAKGIECQSALVGALHDVFAGHAGAIAAATAWWSSQSGARHLLERQVANRGPLQNLHNVVRFSRQESA